MEKLLLCCKCNHELEQRKVSFRYMGFRFNHEVLCCPVCGQAYISEDLASGRVAELERQLEEK